MWLQKLLPPPQYLNAEIIGPAIVAKLLRSHQHIRSRLMAADLFWLRKPTMAVTSFRDVDGGGPAFRRQRMYPPREVHWLGPKLLTAMMTAWLIPAMNTFEAS